MYFKAFVRMVLELLFYLFFIILGLGLLCGAVYLLHEAPYWFLNAFGLMEEYGDIPFETLLIFEVFILSILIAFIGFIVSLYCEKLEECRFEVSLGKNENKDFDVCIPEAVSDPGILQEE